jgi:hypothetical protein
VGVKKMKRLYLLVGLKNGAFSLENSQEVKHRVTAWQSNSTPWHIPRRSENVDPHNDL